MSYQSFEPASSTRIPMYFTPAGLSFGPLSTTNPSAPGEASNALLKEYRDKIMSQILNSGLYTDYGKETPITEHSTVIPCTDTISLRLSPRPGLEYCLLDFVSAVDGTRIETDPGLSVYQLFNGHKCKLQTFGRFGSQAQVYKYNLNVNLGSEYEIRSAADDRYIMPLTFKIHRTPVLKPRAAN